MSGSVLSIRERREVVIKLFFRSFFSLRLT